MAEVYECRYILQGKSQSKLLAFHSQNFPETPRRVLPDLTNQQCWHFNLYWDR